MNAFTKAVALSGGVVALGWLVDSWLGIAEADSVPDTRTREEVFEFAAAVVPSATAAVLRPSSMRRSDGRTFVSIDFAKRQGKVDLVGARRTRAHFRRKLIGDRFWSEDQ